MTTVERAKHRIWTHLLCILLASALIGGGANTLLFKSGIHSLAIRNAIALTISYAAFFAVVKLWLSHLRRNQSELLDFAAISAPETKFADDPKFKRLNAVDPRDGKQFLGESLDRKSNKRKSGDRAACSFQNFDLSELPESGVVNVLILTIVAIIALLFGLLIWFGAEGPFLLSDVALEAALSTGLLRAYGSALRNHWSANLFKKTVVAYICVLGVSTLVLLGAAHICPAESRMWTVLTNCLMHSH